MAKKPVVGQFQINFSDAMLHFEAPSDTYDEKQREFDEQNFLNDGQQADEIIQAHLYPQNRSIITSPTEQPFRGRRYDTRRFPRFKPPPHIGARG